MHWFFTLHEYVKTLGLPADAEMTAHWEHRLSNPDFRASLLSAIQNAQVAEPFWRATIGVNDGGHPQQFALYKIRDLRVKAALVEDDRSNAELSVIAEYYIAGTSVPLDQSGGLSQLPPRVIAAHGEAEVTFEVSEDAKLQLLLTDPDGSTWDADGADELEKALRRKATELGLPFASLNLIAEREPSAKIFA